MNKITLKRLVCTLIILANVACVVKWGGTWSLYGAFLFMHLMWYTYCARNLEV